MEKIYSNELIINMSCFKIHNSVVQPWCKKQKEKCKCLKIKHLHFCLVPGAEVLILLYIEVQIDLTA